MTPQVRFVRCCLSCDWTRHRDSRAHRIMQCPACGGLVVQAPNQPWVLKSACCAGCGKPVELLQRVQANMARPGELELRHETCPA